ncbi:MAG: TIGR01841 family phasin [Alphaproteobacteria bacterium]
MAANQFPKFDFEALLKQFNVPNVDAQAIMEAQQKNIEALVAANQKIAENMQKIAEREQQIVQAALSNWSAAAGDIGAGGDIGDRSARGTEAAIKAIEDGIRNVRSFAELVAQAQAESMDILNKRMDEGIKELRQQVTKAAGRSAKPKK